jgi:Nucleotidyl transferase AbiEii toxin, Type IV TA system
MTAPSRATIAGKAYLDLRRKARQDRRPVDELIQLYVLEGFLARLAQTPFAERFVLKGGMLLAALGERRPTRDIDLQASPTGSDTGTMLAAVRQIASTPVPDGVVFDLKTAAAREIRDEDIYPGVRVTMTARLATARERVHDLGVFKAIGMTPRQTIAMVTCWVSTPAIIATALALPTALITQDILIRHLAAQAGMVTLPASFVHVLGAADLALLILAGLAIALTGALGPASWAAAAKATTALHAE